LFAGFVFFFFFFGLRFDQFFVWYRFF